jgi:hypothetical protein
LLAGQQRFARHHESSLRTACRLNRLKLGLIHRPHIAAFLFSVPSSSIALDLHSEKPTDFHIPFTFPTLMDEYLRTKIPRREPPPGEILI